MSTQQAKQINPIQYLTNLSTTYSYDACKENLKRVYQLVRPTLTESDSDTLLCEIYSNISYTCPDGICSFWRYMTK